MISLDDTSQALRILSDSTRLRILHLLSREELTVAELQGILQMGQSRVSTQLAQLRKTGLVVMRKDGTKSFYHRVPSDSPAARAFDELSKAIAQSDEAQSDQEGLREVLRARQRDAQAYFDRIADAIEHEYLPGRTWEGLAKALFALLPRQRVADLGIGSGELTLLLCQASERVIGVDYSSAMLEKVRARAERTHVDNLELRRGEIEQLPLKDGEVDVVILSQALHHADDPQLALREAHRVLADGGRILILDLLRHDQRWVRERFQDRWPGFLQRELLSWLSEAGFDAVDTSVVARERQPPYFQTLLATGIRGAP